jgi:hypothetical protein
LKLQKHEVDDVTSDAGKKDLVAMIYIEALNKSYKEVGLTNKYDELKLFFSAQVFNVLVIFDTNML